MKKILLISLFISFKMFGQTPKMEIVASTTEDIGGLKVVLKKTNPINYSSAIQGLNNSTNGVGNGVVGEHAGSGIGVYGRSLGGTGVYGFSQFGTGTSGVYGLAYGAGSKGVRGYSENGYGHGVYGSAESGIGVVGYAQNIFSTTGIGGHFSNASATGYALITGSGRVGIGTETPAAKMDIKGSVNFSHFYYDTVEDTYIRGGKAGSKVLINDIVGSGSVGIGLANPNELLDVNGRMRIRHNVNTSGLWLSNSANSLSSADGAFYGMKLDTETGIFIGGNWRFWVNNVGNTTITGFTQLGNGVPSGAAASATAPVVKIMKLTGTTSSTAAGIVAVAHGLANASKVLSYSVLVYGNTISVFPPEYTYNAGYQYSTYCSNTSIHISNSTGNSSNILNKSFTVMITYEE